MCVRKCVCVCGLYSSIYVIVDESFVAWKALLLPHYETMMSTEGGSEFGGWFVGGATTSVVLGLYCGSLGGVDDKGCFVS